MQLSLSQIRDIDKMPFYLKTLGELSLEDNNIVFNYREGADTSQKYNGAGITINMGDGVDKNVTFQTTILNTLTTNSNTNEYTGTTGYTNLGFSTELNDIVIRNENNNGVKVLAEFDILDGGNF